MTAICSYFPFVCLFQDSADIIDEENIREAILRTIHSVGTD